VAKLSQFGSQAPAQNEKTLKKSLQTTVPRTQWKTKTLNVYYFQLT